MGLIENLTNIKSQITSLITYANTTTGESDTTIGDAVDSLIAGYGGGYTFHKEAHTLTEETSVYDFVNNLEYVPKYADSFIWLVVTGNNVASQGSYTVNSFGCQFIIGGKICYGSGIACFRESGLKSPSALTNFSMYGLNTAYVTSVDIGTYGWTIPQIRKDTTVAQMGYIASGNTVTLYELPLNAVTLEPIVS